MPTHLIPNPSTTAAAAGDPQAVVEAFLSALADSELDRALPLLHEDVVYTNVGLPTVYGRRKVEQAFRGLERETASFEVYLHSIATDGPVVLTERTDVLSFGSFRSQFWVWGRFDVHDGVITLWRDSFDFLDLTRSMLRGLVGDGASRSAPDSTQPE